MAERFKKSKRNIPKLPRRLRLAARSILAGLALVSSASAQYSFDPSNADEQGGGIKYFGSAKDERGALLPSVTVKIANAFMFVTDEQGRYRGSVDDNYTPDETTVVCSKPGYQFVRVVKRPGPAGAARQTVEADCLLHKE